MADHSQIARVQWDDMQQHLNKEHLKGKGNSMSNLSFTEQLRREFAEHLRAMWDQLDDYMVTAMEWPEINPNSSVSEKLQDEIQKTKEIAAGRGMAEAIYIMCPGDYSSSDDVVRLAVDRYSMNKGVELGSNEMDEVPVPPGLGVFVDPARGAVETNTATAAPVAATAPVISPPAPALAPISAVVAAQPTAPQPVAAPAPVSATVPLESYVTAVSDVIDSGLSVEQIEAMKTAIAGGLSPEMLADSFGVPVKTVKLVTGG